MNHRGLQRALFRMLHDPSFAARVRAGEAQALASLGLVDTELRQLRGLDAVALSADRDGKRLTQFLRNVTSEFGRSVALGPRGDGASDWIITFASSPHLHRAVAEDRSLPRAFAAFAAEQAAPGGGPMASFRATLALETAMVEARRQPVARLPPGPGEVVLSPWTRLLELAAGSFALASALTELQQRGAAPADWAACARDKAPDPRPAVRETLLLAAAPEPPRPGAQRELRVEPATPLVAAFLRAHERPSAPSAWRSFALCHDLAVDEVEAVAFDFAREGVLLVG